MSSQLQRIYLDASVYLAVLKREADRIDIAKTLLRDGKEQRFKIVASTMVYAEVCGAGRVRTPHDATAVDALVSTFFENGPILWVEADLTVARTARRLARTYKLPAIDAVHLASAIRASCEVLMTWDKTDFPIGATIDGVKLAEPYLFGQMRLDDTVAGGAGGAGGAGS